MASSNQQASVSHRGVDEQIVFSGSLAAQLETSTGTSTTQVGRHDETIDNSVPPAMGAGEPTPNVPEDEAGRQ